MSDDNFHDKPIKSSVNLPEIESDDNFTTTVFKYSTFFLDWRKFYSVGPKSDIWLYDIDNGVWKPNGLTFVQNMMAHLQDRYYKSNLTNEVVTRIRHLSYNDDTKLGGPADKIVVQNGVLNVTDGSFTEGFDPVDLHIAKLPVVYDKDADCPNIKRFLSEVISNENDRAAVVEFFGYCIYKMYVYEIIMLFVGEGANGKSILLSFLRSFLGHDNVTSVTPQQIEKSQFATAQLYNKLANIAGDIPARPIKDAGSIKMLTGGDLINAQHKHRDQFDFVNHAKLIFSANKVPESWDGSTAFYRRFKIIEFPNRFSPSDENFLPRDILLEQLTTEEELSGFLNMALEGLNRLRNSGCLTGDENIEDKKLDYIRRSDPVHYFLETYTYHDPEAVFIAKNVLYDIYIKFCYASDKVPVSDSWFGKKVKMLAPYVGESRPREGDQRTQVWTGLGLDYEKYDKDIIDNGRTGHSRNLSVDFGRGSVKNKHIETIIDRPDHTNLDSFAIEQDKEEKEVPEQIDKTVAIEEPEVVEEIVEDDPTKLIFKIIKYFDRQGLDPNKGMRPIEKYYRDIFKSAVNCGIMEERTGQIYALNKTGNGLRERCGL